MKLNKTDKETLLGWGYSECDFPQIEETFKKSKTKYKLGVAPISREDAISSLGIEGYLSGIARSAFHYTAARNTPDGKVIYFDSSKLFR